LHIIELLCAIWVRQPVTYIVYELFGSQVHEDQ